MATVTGYTAARMKEIEDKAITDGSIVSGNLILYPNNYPTQPSINAGAVIGPAGPTGPGGDVSLVQMDNAIAAAVYPLRQPTSCKVERINAVAVPHNTFTVLSFDEATTEAWDSGSMHSTSVNPNRLTIPTAGNGIYQCSVNIKFSPGSAVGGTRLVKIRKNGTVIETIQHDVGTSTNYYISATISFYLLAANYIDIEVYHFTGVSQNISGSFSLHKLSI